MTETLYQPVNYAVRGTPSPQQVSEMFSGSEAGTSNGSMGCDSEMECISSMLNTD